MEKITMSDIDDWLNNPKIFSIKITHDGYILLGVNYCIPRYLVDYRGEGWSIATADDPDDDQKSLIFPDDLREVIKTLSNRLGVPNDGNWRKEILKSGGSVEINAKNRPYIIQIRKPACNPFS